MKIPDGLKTCVAFVGYCMADGSYKMAGTIYFVSRDDNGSHLKYAVTAKHVIKGIESKGLQHVYIRLNVRGGSATWFKTNLSDWLCHEDENVDVVALKLPLPPQIDQKFYPLSGAVTDETKRINQIEEGDELIITGLFKHHHGDLRNIPIVRIGNIAAMPVEKIQTRHHIMDGYLIEARSIGGLSGSPVFVNLGLHRYIEGQIKQSDGGPIYFLMGMIYGHYDSNITEIDDIIEDAGNTNQINMGIAIVTPIDKVIELLDKIESIN